MFIKIQNPKPNSQNLFIHRDAWFSICDFAYTSKDDQWAPPINNTIPHSPENIPPGSIIYATPWGIERFLKEIHPIIKNPYILVTFCYGPVSTIADYVHNPKILAWFGQANSDAIKYDKFTLMPLGILADSNLYNKRDEIITLFQQFKDKNKNTLLYMNFKIHEGEHVSLGDRHNVYHLFKDKSFCKSVYLTHEWRKPFLEYMDDMSQCKFTISPEGDMHDCYRHWEALLVGSIPIIHKSPLDNIFTDLPVIIVDNYNEITEDFLNQKYEEIKNKQYNLDKIYMKYWESLIVGVRENFINTKETQ